ncbi:hypothetical protein [Pedobacter nyackensis]|uniref:hypothetical protein n=1 Tax=Pedobacter nyackensis TaxID=475255 RepID=UPI00292D022E|nr:hypothetical protein [Pedobacter nyackensis]
MKMFKKTKLYSTSLLLLVMVASSIVSCKKQEPIKYSGEDFLYFMNSTNRFKIIPSSGNMNLFYKPEIEFSFLMGQYYADEYAFNLETVSSLPLSVQFDGRVSDKDRKIEIELEGNGKEYCVLPDPETIFIPAHGIEYTLNMKILRPPMDDTSKKTVILKLKNTTDFSPEKHTWSKITYRFGNWFDIPRFYPDLAVNYGAFSPAKMYHIHFAVKRLGAENWAADPNPVILNTFLKSKNQREVNFINPTYGDLYYFLDLVSYLKVYAKTGPVRDAFTALTLKVITLTKELIIERKNAGNPILDETGNEISIP